jgi:hypothetical protein
MKSKRGCCKRRACSCSGRGRAEPVRATAAVTGISKLKCCSQLLPLQQHCRCSVLEINMRACRPFVRPEDEVCSCPSSGTSRHGRVGNFPASYSGDSGFRSQPGDLLSCLRFFVAFLRPFEQISGRLRSLLLLLLQYIAH